MSSSDLLASAKLRFQAADYPETERLVRQALAKAETQRDFPTMAEGRIWLGATLVQQGQYAVAMQCLNEALDLIQTNELSMHAGRACNYMAICFEELGDFAQAVGWYERGLKEARQAGDREVQVYLLSNLADGWVTAGAGYKAMPFLDQAADVARSIGDLNHEASCLSARARLLESLGEREAARRDYRTAVEVARRCPSERILAETLKDKGAFLARNGEPGAALDRLNEALDLAEKLDIRREMFRTHEVLANVYEQLGQWQAALHHYRQFHLIQATVLDDLVKAKVETLNASFELQRARHEQEISRLRNDELAIALKQVESQARELETLSLRDPLTGTYNRRYLEGALGEAFARMKVNRQQLCVAMFDVDHFKQINDRFGHGIGDSVLCRLARIVEQRLRGGDILARYGGEEFVLVLPLISPKLMLDRGEAIRRSIEVEDWSQVAPDLEVTISLGVASIDEAANWEAVIALADQRMYEAKRAGRNRVGGPQGVQ